MPPSSDKENKWKAKGTKSDNWIYQASAQPIYDYPSAQEKIKPI